MSDLLDTIQRSAAGKLSPSATAEELQAAATLAKTVAEAGKANVEAKNNLRQLKLERLKSWSALLVPIVSLLALLGTVITQTITLRQQLDTAQRQSEDTEWRDLLASLRGPSANYASDITVSSRLQAFLNSTRYKEQARDLAARIMGNLTNMSSFAELYDATARVDSPQELKRVLGIARVLSATKTSIESECHAESMFVRPDLYFGICTLILNDKEIVELLKTTKEPATSLARRRSLQAVMDELGFISGHIAAFLRRNYAVGAARSDQPNADLSYVTLLGADLSGVDFSKIELSNTVLSMSKLERANLSPRLNQSAEFGESEWWKAGKIEPNLLRWLLENRFPFFPGVTVYPSGPPDRDEYAAHIKRLCIPLEEFCSLPLQFGQQTYQPGPAPNTLPSELPGGAREPQKK